MSFINRQNSTIFVPGSSQRFQFPECCHVCFGHYWVQSLCLAPHSARRQGNVHYVDFTDTWTSMDMHATVAKKNRLLSLLFPPREVPGCQQC
eukprot:3341379-Amphidinium_carterae.1